MIQQKQRLFTNKMLVTLLIPLVIEQALAILVGFADGVMVSSAGEAAISGVSLVNMINDVILQMFAALATGGAVITSQLLGAKDQPGAKRSAQQLTVLAAIFGIAIMVLCLVFAEGIHDLFFGTVSADVREAGLIYLRITALSFPFIALYNAGAAIFRSLGDSKVSMRVSIVMNIINVGGNAICIYGLNMGVAGVAIPTLVSRAVAAVMILYLAARPGKPLRLELSGMTRINGAMAKKILRIGIPSAAENSLFQLGRVLVVSMISLHGTVHISANAVANTLDAVGCIAGSAFSLSMITVVGRSVGAKDEEQVRYYTKKLMLLAYIVIGVCKLLISAFLPQLIGLYSSLSPETVELATKLVLIHALCGVVLWPAGFVFPNALRAVNDVKYTMWVSVASMVTFRLTLSWLLCVHMGMGALGVWIAMVVDWCCRVTFFVIRWLTGAWKKKCNLAQLPQC